MKVIEVHRRLVRAGVPQLLYQLTTSLHAVPLCWVRRAPDGTLWLHAIWLNNKDAEPPHRVQLRPPPHQCGRLLQKGPTLTRSQWWTVTDVAEPMDAEWMP